MNEVAILGAGPSGLMAALAAQELGYTPTIYSRKVKSQIYAAMFLHRSLPWVTNSIPDFLVKIVKEGTAEGYAEKVYGDPEHPVSWDKFEEGEVAAWDLRKTYDRLWNLFDHDIIEYDLTVISVKDILNEHEVVFSSIPARALCYRSHIFSCQPIWVHTMYSERLAENESMMWYNGGDQMPWYRYSQIKGHRAWEYSYDPGPDGRYKTVHGKKPLGTNCTCFPDIKRIGRFGKWEKQVLTHHCYEEVRDALLAMREASDARSRHRHRRHAS